MAYITVHQATAVTDDTNAQCSKSLKHISQGHLPGAAHRDLPSRYPRSHRRSSAARCTPDPRRPRASARANTVLRQLDFRARSCATQRWCRIARRRCGHMMSIRTDAATRAARTLASSKRRGGRVRGGRVLCGRRRTKAMRW